MEREGRGERRREEGEKEKEVHCIRDRSKGEQWKDGFAICSICTFGHNVYE